MDTADPPRSTDSRFLTSVGEVGDDHASLRKLGDDVQPPAHGLDVGAKVGDIHVRPSLQLGDGRLVDVENIADRPLGHRPRLSQLMKGHGRAKLRLAGVDACPAIRREVLRQMDAVRSFDQPFVFQAPSSVRHGAGRPEARTVRRTGPRRSCRRRSAESPTVSGRRRRTRARADRRSGREARECGRDGSPPRRKRGETEARARTPPAIQPRR